MEGSNWAWLGLWHSSHWFVKIKWRAHHRQVSRSTPFPESAFFSLRLSVLGWGWEERREKTLAITWYDSADLWTTKGGSIGQATPFALAFHAAMYSLESESENATAGLDVPLREKKHQPTLQRTRWAPKRTGHVKLTDGWICKHASQEERPLHGFPRQIHLLQRTTGHVLSDWHFTLHKQEAWAWRVTMWMLVPSYQSREPTCIIELEQNCTHCVFFERHAFNSTVRAYVYRNME